MRAAALEGGRACAGEGQLPLRARRSASRRPPRTRSRVAGPGPSLLALVLVAKYGAASAAHPAERDLRPRGRRDRRLDPGRLGGRRGRLPDAAGRGDPARTSSRPSGCTATTPRCRCWPRSRTRTGRLVGLCPRRPAVRPGPLRRRRRSSTRPTARASIPSATWPGSPGILQADAYAGFNRLYEPGRRAGPDPRGRLLGAHHPNAIRCRAPWQDRLGHQPDRDRAVG